ncbi:MAG: carbon-nitrogen hydrolase family protein [Candidatus Delongbacteria bacterium]|nr:carbon-nitrogen hydrolase family protein [Candidatus Delongbacteria bacterium]
MKILLIQNDVFKNIQDTLDNIENILSKFEGELIDFIIFPEMFTTPYQIDLFKAYVQDDNSLVVSWLKLLAKRYKSYIIGGSVPEKVNDTIYNTSYVFNRTGDLIKKYRKINLFSVVYPDNSSFNEGDVLSSGDEIGLFSTEFGMMGIMICFDIRFPVLANKIMLNDALVIFVPAAFNDFTGPMHWETTFRARAIDNQLFLVGVSPSSNSYGNYKTYGHSLVVNPLGQVIEILGRDQGSILIDIDLKEVEHARSLIPIAYNQKN